MHRHNLQLAVLSLLAAMVGCSYTPSRVQMPKIDSQDSGTAAIEQYDGDKNGLLSSAELAQVPGIQKALKQYDQDKDGSVSAEEISQRIKAWRAAKTGMKPAYCLVTLDVRPLKGAEVKFIPEPFLGTHVKPATGVTNDGGMANMGINTSDLPTDQHSLIGVQCGVYRIEVTHPQRSVPPQYNANSVLGVEVAPGLVTEVRLALKSS